MQALKKLFSSQPAGAREPMRVATKHYILKTDVKKFPAHCESCVFATGCFWGTEKMFWRVPGVHSTSTGYIAGGVEHPTYEEVCTGRSGHAECVRVAYDPSVISFADLLAMHWTCHDPTQGDRQGNDCGTQYRSGIYCSTESQLKTARASAETYGRALRDAGKKSAITTEIKGPGDAFYFAEDYHQQYLAKPGSRPYCSAEPTGVAMPAEWLKANGAKLGAGYWKNYGPRPGCTIGVPNEPIPIDKALSAA